MLWQVEKYSAKKKQETEALLHNFRQFNSSAETIGQWSQAVADHDIAMIVIISFINHPRLIWVNLVKVKCRFPRCATPGLTSKSTAEVAQIMLIESCFWSIALPNLPFNYPGAMDQTTRAKTSPSNGTLRGAAGRRRRSSPSVRHPKCII